MPKTKALLDGVPNRRILMSNQRIFVNLTNHPMSGWGGEQLGAAKSCSDMQICMSKRMPVLPAEFGGECILNEAHFLVNELESEVGILGKWITCHIMGEAVLSYCLVKLLQSFGVECVVSTTERVVEETVSPKGETVKTSVFKFVRFREYPTL